MTGIQLLGDWVRRVQNRKYMTNEWLYGDDMKVYVRKSRRAEGICLDLATVQVYRTGQGTFAAFLEAAHAMNLWDGTFVECVHNPRLAAYLERKGFQRSGEEAPNFFLSTKSGLRT